MDTLFSSLESFILRDDAFLLGLVFLAVVLTVFALAALLRRDSVAVRFARAGRSASQLSDVSLRFGDSDLRRHKLLSKLQTSFGSLSDEKRSSLKRMLVRAGLMSSRAPFIYYSARLVSALILPILALVILSLMIGSLAPDILILVTIGFCLVGYMLPYVVVRLRTSERQREAREGFPDAMDMLLVCVEAGLGLSAAIDRVSGEILRSNRVLAEHFTLVNLEVRAGTSRSDALKNFADRAGVTEISALVTLLIQSENLGTSIADSLRVYASEMRSKRLIRAEEKANKLPVKMALPLGFAILPCLIIVVMTPMIIRMVRELFPVLAG